ncbi:MAG: stage II sporulation protein R [Brotaphodocola sp.]
MDHFFHKYAKQNHSILYLTISLAFFLLALLFGMEQIRTADEAHAALLSPYVLRFHIMANSNSRADQDVKLEIRSLVLDYLKKSLPADADKEETANWLTSHQSDIEEIANCHLDHQNCNYKAHLELINCYFPTRYYGGLTLPCGNYDAARITLGTGKGHNWWCVLYPRYCFVDEVQEKSAANTNAALADSQTQQSGTLPSEEHRPAVKFRIKLLSLFHKTD